MAPDSDNVNDPDVPLERRIDALLDAMRPMLAARLDSMSGNADRIGFWLFVLDRETGRYTSTGNLEAEGLRAALSEYLTANAH